MSGGVWKVVRAVWKGCLALGTVGPPLMSKKSLALEIFLVSMAVILLEINYTRVVQTCTPRPCS